jgi:hypothetical protein
MKGNIATMQYRSMPQGLAANLSALSYPIISRPAARKRLNHPIMHAMCLGYHKSMPGGSRKT